jgi:UTP--glucose-1-phosphate uridylyltransferase
MDDQQVHRFTEKMRYAGVPDLAIGCFVRSLCFVADGGATEIAESAICPVDGLESLSELQPYDAAGRNAMHQCVVIKLNGGLGTSMGLSRAKSLLEVRPGMSFLDMIAQQILSQRAAWASPIPFLLMNSYRTRDDSLAALSKYSGLTTDLPLDFVQNKVPRIDADTWEPVTWAEDPSLEWCPPGHGDLYVALKCSGMLDRLLARNVRYAFVSNADNLGAVLDSRILGWFAENQVPFAMEVAHRTHADRKGGHLALRDGQLILREVAQCPVQERSAFEDVTRYGYFNTNNLWLDLQALAMAFEQHPLGLPLPVIRNHKRVSSTDGSSPACYQLETAMGSAIECFEGAQAIAVPRDRFSPVKTTNDLLAVWSDAFELTSDFRLVAADPAAYADCVIDLDPTHFGHVGQLADRFADGPPSLIGCRRFAVTGDYSFGAGVTVAGDVRLANEGDGQIRVAAGEVLGQSAD